jgi:hypothetical protein
MGTSSSKEGDLTEEKWNQAEDSAERYKTDMLTLINVIKFCAKTQRDSQREGHSIPLEYEWSSAIAKAMAASDDQSKSKIWNQVADAAKKVTAIRGCARMAEDAITMPATIATASAEKVVSTVAEAWHTAQRRIVDVLVQVEVAKDWDDATRKATREKTEKALSACAQARVMSKHVLRTPLLSYYYSSWCGDHWQISKDTNTIYIQCCTRSSPYSFVVSSFAIRNDNDDAANVIVMEIEDTTTPFVEIEDIAPFSELCRVVHEAKQTISDLVNHLRTLYDTHMQTKLDIQ